MEKIILYVDDAAYAREFLARLAPDAAGTGARHWVLVACAPRMTHRISKWVSHSARENWRAKWFAKVQEQMLPAAAARRRPGHAGAGQGAAGRADAAAEAGARRGRR